jgi:GDP-mannose 6-dehydrogenase
VNVAPELSCEPVRIAVLGLGYVGCVTAACLAECGHTVIGVDRDSHKAACVNAGHAPFFEPGLDELVARNRAAGRLTAISSLTEALAKTELAFICVGTPPAADGSPALEQLHRVCGEILAALPHLPAPPVVVLRSTVFPDECEALARRFEARGVAMVDNPEFLREGNAVSDFMEPALVVVGGDDSRAVEKVASIYRGLRPGIHVVPLRAAAMIKYACNSFHAVKVTFANEIGALCGALGISGRQVMDVVCGDVKLNASAAYLKPGFAFGGSCLSKDVRALVNATPRLNVSAPLLSSVLPSNDEHLKRALDRILRSPAARTGVFGLAFKENTDDLRGSPVVLLIRELLLHGRQVRVFDPRIQMANIYGSNRDYAVASLPEVERLLEPSMEQLLEWADQVALVQKPSAEVKQRLRESGLPVLDLVGEYSAPHIQAAPAD